MNFLTNSGELPALLKYPRTPHLEGSRLQEGDEGHDQAPYSVLAGRYIVVEEKLDGGNCGLSYDAAGEQLLQSRGHYLTGGGRERQFNLFKRWASAHADVLLERLGDRYVMYGEWLHKITLTLVYRHVVAEKLLRRNTPRPYCHSTAGAFEGRA